MLNYCCSKSSGVLHSLLPLRLPLSESLQELFLRLQPQPDYACPFCCFLSFLSHLWYPPQDRNGECNTTLAQVWGFAGNKTVNDGRPALSQSPAWFRAGNETPFDWRSFGYAPKLVLSQTQDIYWDIQLFPSYYLMLLNIIVHSSFSSPLHRFLGSSISSIYCFASWDPVLRHFW